MQARLREILDLDLADDTRAWQLDADGTWHKVADRRPGSTPSRPCRSSPSPVPGGGGTPRCCTAHLEGERSAARRRAARAGRPGTGWRAPARRVGAFGPGRTRVRPGPAIRRATHVVRAAAGRSGAGPDGALEVVLVHRPRYDDWSLPKGKVDPGETDEQAALREVREEASIDARIGPELPTTTYLDRSGKQKRVRYWAMTVAGGDAGRRQRGRRGRLGAPRRGPGPAQLPDGRGRARRPERGDEGVLTGGPGPSAPAWAAGAGRSRRRARAWHRLLEGGAL